MNLYLIARHPDGPKCGWDEYDSAVVVAESHEDARLIHPVGCKSAGDKKVKWPPGVRSKKRADWTAHGWVEPRWVMATLLGPAGEGALCLARRNYGVVLAHDIRG